jgi:rhodanese-related sulfurtransferase
MIESIEISRLKKLLQIPLAPIILDVRRKDDVVASPEKIRGAVWRDPEKINDWSAELSVGRKIITYCVKGGPVSQSVAERLEQEGHDVAFLAGGIKAWLEAGEPVE